MNVCFISHSSWNYGAERSLVELIDALGKKGVGAYVVLPSYGPLAEKLKYRKIKYSIIRYKWWVGEKVPFWKRICRLFINTIAVFQIALKIRSYKCEIVYTNTSAIFVGAVTAKLLRLPHVWHIHEFIYKNSGLSCDLGRKSFFWTIGRLSDVCIVNSKAVAEEYGKYIPAPKLRTIYYSVKISELPFCQEFNGLKNGIFKSLVIGNICPNKNQEEAIRAIGYLAGKGMKVELSIIGGGNQQYIRYLHNLIKAAGLETNIKFRGYLENPLEFILNADVLLMCSRCEAFGRTIIEAMKAGKPVIAAGTGGVLELIQDGFNGLIYTNGDYKELAEKIKFLQENHQVAKRIGENARQWATAGLSEARFGQEVFAVLEGVIKDG
jgi:glycosyltransferase involved in cell wall biosynthesis